MKVKSKTKLSEVKVNEEVVLTCSVARTDPPVELIWRINRQYPHQEFISDISDQLSIHGPDSPIMQVMFKHTLCSYV